jgi:hypothetical protein
MNLVNIRTGEILNGMGKRTLTPTDLKVIPTLSVGPFTATRRGLIVHSRDVPIEVWGAYIMALAETGEALQLILGDALNWGEETYGQECYQYLEQLGYVDGTYANWKWVAGRVKRSLRNENLTFSHHVPVAPLEPEEQEKWLSKAEEEGWSARQLRKEIIKDSIPQKGDLAMMHITMSFEVPDGLQNRLKESVHRFRWAAEEWDIKCLEMNVWEDGHE